MRRRKPFARRFVESIGGFLATPRGRREALWGGGTAVALVLLILFLLGRSSESEFGDATSLEGSVSEPVRELVKGMSAEQKVDEVLALGFAGQDAASPVHAELRARQLGGVFVGGDNWVDAGQGGALISGLRAAGRVGGRVPPLVIVEQEGGTYRSFQDLPPLAGEILVGDNDSSEDAKTWARESAAALKRAGADLNLFPIADVASLDSPVADRAFSDSAEVVATMTAAAIRGCEAVRLACAPGHFPGLGGASQDTDEGPATVGLDKDTLEERDLRPFRAAVAEGAPALVLSHAFYAAYDAVTPGSLSSAVATTLLRGKLRFGGVAITDDLDAGAVRAGRSLGEAAVDALVAGADLLLIEEPGPEQERARAALLRAERTGRVSGDRLDAAVGHVLELKHKLGLLRL